MINRMQSFLIQEENQSKLFEIVRLFHPYLTSMNGLSVSAKYDWICVRGGAVDIGIQFPTGLTGTGWKKEDFEKQHNNNKFKAWRFADDKYYGKSEYFGIEYMSALNPYVHTLMTLLEIPKPTPHEMMKYYYSD